MLARMLDVALVLTFLPICEVAFDNPN